MKTIVAAELKTTVVTELRTDRVLLVVPTGKIHVQPQRHQIALKTTDRLVSPQLRTAARVHRHTSTLRLHALVTVTVRLVAAGHSLTAVVMGFPAAAPVAAHHTAVPVLLAASVHPAVAVAVPLAAVADTSEAADNISV